jgi:NTP pyrophosphohydrolases containing a Zn-finger, probably nucleic-acid-binding
MPRLDRLSGLSRGMHDRAACHRDDPDWLDQAWKRSRVLVLGTDMTTAVEDSGTGPRLHLRHPDEISADPLRLFLGEYEETPYFAVLGERDVAGDRWASLLHVGAELSDLDAGLFTEAVALGQWHLRHPCCSRCGELTEVHRAGWVRRCPRDGSEHWPRTDPAIIVLVHDGADRCVLGRQASWPAGRYSILAGFVEPGEPAEAAVAREVAEEVGIAITDLRYLGSQPWPFPASLMLGYSARVQGDPTLRLTDSELEDARWVHRDELRRGDGVLTIARPVSIAHRIITDWLDAG